MWARESPDFGAFTGDMVTGYNWDGKPGWFKKQWLKFSERMTRLRLPYAYVLGNHDVEVCRRERIRGRQICRVRLLLLWIARIPSV